MIDDGVLAERQWRNDDVVVVFSISFRSPSTTVFCFLSFLLFFFRSFFLSFFLLTHGKNPFHFKYRKSCAVLLDEFKVALEMYNNPWRLARV